MIIGHYEDNVWLLTHIENSLVVEDSLVEGPLVFALARVVIFLDEFVTAIFRNEFGIAVFLNEFVTAVFRVFDPVADA